MPNRTRRGYNTAHSSRRLAQYIRLKGMAQRLHKHLIHSPEQVERRQEILSTFVHGQAEKDGRYQRDHRNFRIFKSYLLQPLLCAIEIVVTVGAPTQTECTAWQKGTIGNRNGLLREFYPEGRNFRISPATLKRDLALLNARPRKVLNFHSAQELWDFECNSCCTV